MLRRLFQRVTNTSPSFLRTATQHVLGIDLGTTNTCISVLEGGRPVVIETEEGHRTMPSIVGIQGDGAFLVGEAAKRQQIVNGQGTFSAIKRLLGREWGARAVQELVKDLPYQVSQKEGDIILRAHGREYSPSEISGVVLRKAKEIAERYLQEPVKKAVVTVPAYFSDRQRQATKEAGRLAGLDILRVLNEPTAAALAYGTQLEEVLEGGKEKNHTKLKEEPQIIVVYDLGGGTFDVSILSVEKGVYEVQATNGDSSLGGEDFDARLVEHLKRKIEAEHRGIIFNSDSTVRLRSAAEEAKKDLSSSEKTTIHLPFLGTQDGQPVHGRCEVTRGEFEDMTSDLLERTIQPCLSALVDSGVEKTQISKVLLVGGMTRMPSVGKTVERVFGQPPSHKINPDEVVALGAAIQGGVLGGTVSDVLLLDVTPLTLGIETTGGVFSSVLARNTSLPAKQTQLFTTTEDNQSEVEINVYQGEKELVKDNTLLGSFVLKNIPPAPKGIPKIEVTFDIDTNGIATVSAKERGSNKDSVVIIATCLEDGFKKNI